MLDFKLRHREVLGIASRKRRTDAYGGCSDQAVALAEGDSLTGIISTPTPGALALRSTKRRQVKAAQQARHERFLLAPCAAQHLLDIDGAYPGHIRRVA